MSFIKPVADIIRQSRSERILSHLRYPLDLGAHGIVMNFKDYSYDNTFNQTTALGSLTDSVALPLPVNLQDNMQLKVGGNELGAGGAGFADVASGNANIGTQTIANSISSTHNSFEDISKTLKNGFQNGQYGESINSIIGILEKGAGASKYFARAGVEGLFPGAGLAFDITSRTAINPHVTVDFDGVGLKRHTFEWTFAPKNEDESQQLKNVTDLFKRKSLPKYQGILTGENGGAGSSLSRGLLTYPSLVEVFFVGVDPGFFWYFKTCMIAAININYTPQGIALAKGGKPAVVNIQMELQESLIHTAEDYGDSGSAEGIEAVELGGGGGR